MSQQYTQYPERGQIAWPDQAPRPHEIKQSFSKLIVGFYNSTRLRSKLGSLPPNIYEHQMAEKQPIPVSDIP